MVVNNEVLEAEAFDKTIMVGFYGEGESFAKMVQPRDSCYVEQGWHNNSTRELKGVSRTFPKEDECK